METLKNTDPEKYDEVYTEKNEIKKATDRNKTLA
jgi:hypothetical protein